MAGKPKHARKKKPYVGIVKWPLVPGFGQMDGEILFEGQHYVTIQYARPVGATDVSHRATLKNRVRAIADALNKHREGEHLRERIVRALKR